MRLVIAFFQNVVVLAFAFLGIAILSNFMPLAGVCVAIVVGLIALFAIWRPLPLLWLGNRLVSGLLASIAVLALITSADMEFKRRAADEIARRTQSERHLAELRQSNPKA
jgi:hypothetical protein